MGALSLVLLPLAVATLGAAAYAQHRIGRQVEGRGWVLVMRCLLAAAGTGLGLLVASDYSGVTDHAAAIPALVFLVIFGAVHVPAAVILHLKRLRARQLREEAAHRP